MSDFLGRLKAASHKVIKVQVPGVDGDFYLKQFSVRDSLDYVSYVDKHPEASDFAAIVALSLCDANGTPVVGLDNIAEVNELSPEIVAHLVEEFNKIREVEVKPDEANPSRPDPS